LWPRLAHTQNITIDGSLGPAQTLSGPNYTVGAALGQQAGGNLFQSFGAFSLNAGENANFTGPASVTNILGRVTGGGASTINGSIQSSVSGANLYLVNPAGITLSGAALNLTGDFHATTANYVRLADSNQFLATTSPPSTLTGSLPVALGFTSATPAAMTVNGSTLATSIGSILQLAGGPINVTGSTLSSGGGGFSRIFLIGVAGTGLVGSGSTIGSSFVTAYAPVQLTNSLVVASNRVNTAAAIVEIRGSTIGITGTEIDVDSYANTFFNGAYLRADQITINGGSDFHANARAVGFNGGIELRTNDTGPFRSGSVTIDNSTVRVDSGSVGFPAHIDIFTGALVVTNNATLRSLTTGAASGGAIIAYAWTIEVSSGAVVSSAATGSGARGSVTLDAPGGFSLAGGTVSGVRIGGAITSSGGTLDGISDAVGFRTASLTTVSGTTTLQAANTYSGGTTVNGGTLQLAPGASLLSTGALTINGGTFNLGNNALTIGALAGSGGTIALGSGTLTTNSTANTSLASTITGTGALVKQGTGILTLTGNNSYGGGTTVNGGLINFAAANNFGTGTITLNGGGLQWATGNTADISARFGPLGANGATFDTNGNNVTFATALGGPGSLTKQGAGTLSLGGANSYSGGTTVNAGILRLASGASLAAGSALTLNGGTFDLNGNNQAVGALSGAGGAITLGNGTLTAGDSSSTILASVISGTGGLTKQGSGTLNLTGNSTYTGSTAVNAGTLLVNGSIVSTVTLGNGGTLGGSGTIGGLVSNGGTLSPGNSIGTLNINGNFTQNGGIYVVEINPQGQADRINATGTATINGGTVTVQAQSGTYARRTNYTILTANGGVSGTYSNVTGNFAFLTPSLSYDANNVFLTLFMSQSAFAAGARTANQFAVGSALDQANASATGDFNTVLNALSVLSTQQGPWALNQISGQPYADFGSFNVANNALFMNALGQQMALARGGAGSGQRQALAETCDVASCDGTSPFSVWGSVLGGVGSVQGDGNSQVFTYNIGGAAAGIDYRLTPSFLVGLGAGYTNATQWVDSFQGKSWSNTVSVAAYGSFTQWGLYVDALAGYAYSNNQMQRQISIPGLQPRTANGSTGADQFLGQVETGYAVPVYAPAAVTVTPFARFQASSINQAAFSEWGANSLSLNVQQQTTTSMRTTLGADLAGAIGLSDTRTLDLGLRLGWLHEYANTARPLTAAFAGAPSANFTVYGATPQRDAAVIGFSASTNVATAMQLYLRYDGEIGGSADNHTLNLGLRLSW
jgi:filamentous hemagglutinin family protein